jgi:fructokinase
MAQPLYAAIEAGGTKFVCAVGTGPDDLRDEVRLPTTTPRETLASVVAHLQKCQDRHGKISALGVGTFGPAGVHPGAVDYGKITTTPKPGWADTDLLGTLLAAFPVPAGFDTDVNAAALGEFRWGAAQGIASVLYLTVGTGIGGGFCLNGQPLHGLLHPEMGHIHLPHDRLRDPFPGACPWHADCLEGLASGTAMQQRWQTGGQHLPPDHPAWELEAEYLGMACANFLCTLSPQRIILGGGVMEAPGLLEKVRQATLRSLAGYLRHPEISSGLESTIIAPGLGNRSGICGALALAEAACAH